MFMEYSKILSDGFSCASVEVTNSVPQHQNPYLWEKKLEKKQLQKMTPQIYANLSTVGL